METVAEPYLLFNFLNALIIIDQNRMALVVAVYAVLYLIAAVIMILINGTASKKHSRSFGCCIIDHEIRNVK